MHVVADAGGDELLERLLIADRVNVRAHLHLAGLLRRLHVDALRTIHLALAGEFTEVALQQLVVRDQLLREAAGPDLSHDLFRRAMQHEELHHGRVLKLVELVVIHAALGDPHEAPGVARDDRHDGTEAVQLQLDRDGLLHHGNREGRVHLLVHGEDVNGQMLPLKRPLVLIAQRPLHSPVHRHLEPRPLPDLVDAPYLVEIAPVLVLVVQKIAGAHVLVVLGDIWREPLLPDHARGVPDLLLGHERPEGHPLQLSIVVPRRSQRIQ